MVDGGEEEEDKEEARERGRREQAWKAKERPTTRPRQQRPTGNNTIEERVSVGC